MPRTKSHLIAVILTAFLKSSIIDQDESNLFEIGHLNQLLCACAFVGFVVVEHRVNLDTRAFQEPWAIADQRYTATKLKTRIAGRFCFPRKTIN